jgi:hypothetical protein
MTTKPDTVQHASTATLPVWSGQHGRLRDHHLRQRPALTTVALIRIEVVTPCLACSQLTIMASYNQSRSDQAFDGVELGKSPDNLASSEQCRRCGARPYLRYMGKRKRPGFRLTDDAGGADRQLDIGPPTHVLFLSAPLRFRPGKPGGQACGVPELCRWL